ncbi:MAG: lipoyl synthase, partial [Elusimicrobia bacterium]|nr:lipoyl synthase [Elusimicrobiota bacterium]
KPLPPDPQEPARIAATAAKWKLRYAVLTSPTRDDLPDGGSAQFSATVRALRDAVPGIGAEMLVPDFAGDHAALETALACRPEVFAHNVETVPQLYSKARAGADYRRSLKVLENAAKRGALVKSGFMVGLGETGGQMKTLLSDLASTGCALLTIGQYLAPSKLHCPVEKYYEPAEFDALKELALEAGLKNVVSGPLVRSSYKAGEQYRAYCAQLPRR